MVTSGAVRFTRSGDTLNTVDSQFAKRHQQYGPIFKAAFSEAYRVYAQSRG